jgi:hypothetical protein
MYIGADVTGCVAAGMGVVRARASKDLALTMHGAAPQVCAMSRGGDALVSNRWIRSVRPCTGLLARNSVRSLSITACMFTSAAAVARLTVQIPGFVLTLYSRPSSFAGLAIREECHFSPNAMCCLFPHQIFQILPCVTFRQLAFRTSV